MVKGERVGRGVSDGVRVVKRSGEMVGILVDKGSIGWRVGRWV